MCSDHPGASILKEFKKGVALNPYIPSIDKQMHWPVITVKGGNVYSWLHHFSFHFVIPQYQSRSKSNYSKTQPFSVQANLILSIIHQMQLSIFNLEFNNIQLSSVLLSLALPKRQRAERHNNSKQGRSDSSFHSRFFTHKLHMRRATERLSI